jgi:hypothetical protein
MGQVEPPRIDDASRNRQEPVILPSPAAGTRAGEDAAKLRGELMQILRQDFLK